MNNINKQMLLKARTLENMILSHLLDNGVKLSEVELVTLGSAHQHLHGYSYNMIDKSGKKLVRWNYRVDIKHDHSGVAPSSNCYFNYEAYSYITNEYLTMESTL